MFKYLDDKDVFQRVSLYCRYCCTTAGLGYFTLIFRGCCSRDRMVVGFITTYTISVYSIQHYVIKFASDLQHVCGFLRVLQFFTTNETDRQDITDISILLKLALNTILTLTQPTHTHTLIFGYEL